MSDSIFSSDKKIINLNSKDMFSIESFTAMQSFAKDRIDVKNRIIHDWPWIELDSISRNRSYYESTGYLNALHSLYIQEQLRRGTWFGELDHPDANCSRERFLTVDHDNINHRLMNYHLVNNVIVGDVQFVAPKGNITWDWVEKGVNLSLSTRVLTPQYEEREAPDGQTYIHKFGNMRLVTFDMISSLPGFQKMNIVSLDDYDASKEDWKGVKLNWTAGRKKDEFMRLLNSQESLPIMEDIYGFNMKDVKHISYSEEGLLTLDITVGSHYSKSIKIPTNVYNVNRCLSVGK